MTRQELAQKLGIGIHRLNAALQSELIEPDLPLEDDSFKIYVVGFKGVTLGGQAITVARNRAAALGATVLELHRINLPQALPDEAVVGLIDPTSPGCTIIDNGDY